MSVFDRLGDRKPGWVRSWNPGEKHRRPAKEEEPEEEPESEMAIELRENTKTVTEGEDTVISLYDTEVPRPDACRTRTIADALAPCATSCLPTAARSSCASASSTSR